MADRRLNASESKPVLAVDLDGTLVYGDLARDHALAYARKGPLAAIRLLRWLQAGGRLRLKVEVAKLMPLDPNRLAWRAETIAFIRIARAAGHKVALATASVCPYAEAVAGKLGLFDDVLCSSETENLHSERKAAKLDAEYGEDGWDYIGDSPVQDLPVFARARVSHFVRPTPSMLAGARQAGTTICEGPTRKDRLRGAWRLLRPVEWLINACLMLILPLPLLLDGQQVAPVLLAFAVCCLASSCIAIVGAIFALPDDLAQPSRRNTPLAAGDISASQAAAAAAFFLLGAIVLGTALPLQAAGLLACYFVLAVTQRIWLAESPVASIASRSASHVLRLAAGVAAAGAGQILLLLAGAAVLFTAAEIGLRTLRKRRA